jgi:hypothetical protein
MDLHGFETILKFGQHKGETVAEILTKNTTYIEWCYGNIDDFYITDAVWKALDCHKGLEDVLMSGEIDTQDVRNAIAENKNLHEKKRSKYKKHMIETYEYQIDKKIKGSSNEK